MDSFELNKILGAILGTCILVLVTSFAAHAIFAPVKPEKPGFEIAVKEDTSHGGAAKEAAAPAEPIEKLLQTASVEKGAGAAKKCAACHTFGKGEPNRVGPNLYGIVGRPKASVPGFNYSAAMRAKGGEWTLEELDQFLQNPRAHVPGTTMSFAGVPRGTERADLITFLNSRSDNPMQLPKEADAGNGPVRQAGIANR